MHKTKPKSEAESESKYNIFSCMIRGHWAKPSRRSSKNVRGITAGFRFFSRTC